MKLPSHSTPASGAVGPAAPFPAVLEPLTRTDPLGTTFADWAGLPCRATPNGFFRPVCDAPAPTMERFEVHVTTLKPGANPHAPHYHPWEEILVLQEGTLEVGINGQRQSASAGAVIFFASNDPHTVWNTSGKPATYYVINFHSEAVRMVGAHSAAARAQPGLLPSGVTEWAEVAPPEGADGLRRGLLASPTTTLQALQIHAITLAAGRSLERDLSDPHLIFLIVRDGEIELAVDGVRRVLGAGSMALLQPGAVRTVLNSGGSSATYYSIGAAAG